MLKSHLEGLHGIKQPFTSNLPTFIAASKMNCKRLFHNVMKKQYLLIALTFALSPFLASGQITLDPNPGVSENLDVSESDIVIYGSITNESDEVKTFTWNRAELMMTDGWGSAVCDPIQCYGVEDSSPDFDFDLEPGEPGIWDIHVYPNNIEGSAVIRVTASEVGNFSNNQTAFYYFNTNVSVAERLNEAVKIYPNPAEELIFIDQGTTVEVSEIELYSLAGKLVVSERINSSNSVEVSTLPTGTYVARLFDADGVQVSSNVVVKK